MSHGRSPAMGPAAPRRPRLSLLPVVVAALAWLAAGCAGGTLEPRITAELAAERVLEHLAAEYPTGLGDTWAADVAGVELVYQKDGWPPWADERPVYLVRVTTSVEADPQQPGTRVRTEREFAVDGLDGTVRLAVGS